MLTLLIVAVLIIAAGYLLPRTFYKIPPMHYGVVDLLGNRVRNVGEGLAMLIPFLEEVQIFSIEAERSEVEVGVKSRDNMGISIEGSVEYQLDPNLLDAYQETEKERAGALVAAVQNEVGNVAGTRDGEDFVRNREAIWLLINCRLRLKEMPHENPQLIGVGKVPKLEQRLAFYKTYAKEIKRLLDEEVHKPSERSVIEEQYGVDVRIFDLTSVDFDEETSKALEKEKQDQAKARAAKQKIELFEKFKTLGLKPDEALDAAERSLGQVTETKVNRIQVNRSLVDVKLGGTGLPGLGLGGDQ